MNSWLYIFSKFTSEALVFETLFILILVATYSAFWVIQRRRFGAAGPTLPSGPVQTYLNQLISNAEYLRMQLFGFSTSSQPPQLAQPVSPAPVLSSSSPSDPTSIERLTRSLEAMTSEKNRLEAKIQEMEKAAKDLEGSRPSSAGQNDEVIRLEHKIHTLEDKLSEYSIIEDDLANLKRFQQENAKYKAYLQEKGLEGPDLTPLPTKPESKGVSGEEKSAPEPSSGSSSLAKIADKMGSSLDLPSPSEVLETSEVSDLSVAEPSLSAEPARKANPLEALGDLAQAHEAADKAGGDAPNKKSEDDLVKEFEKMLQG